MTWIPGSIKAYITVVAITIPIKAYITVVIITIPIEAKHKFWDQDTKFLI